MTATVMVSPEVCCQSILADLYGARSASCAAACRSTAGPKPIRAAAAVPVFRNVRRVGTNDFISLVLPVIRLLPVKLEHCANVITCQTTGNGRDCAAARALRG